MSLTDKVFNYLKSQPLFRERKNKDRGMVNLLREMYPVLKDIDKDTLIGVVQDYNSMDRAWRKHLADNVWLRGTDYEQKEELEIKKQRELGYNI